MVAFFRQKWRNLLFLHWQCEAADIQQTLPKGLFVDTFEGNAYFSVAAFLMEDVRLGYLPAIPGFSHFIEINTRTYIYDEYGTVGVWFYTMDLNSYLCARLAKKAFSLPYLHAQLRNGTAGSSQFITGNRKDHPQTSIQFNFDPIENPIYFAQEGTLDYFLVERYVMFAEASSRLYNARVRHTPYPLQSVKIKSFNPGLINAYPFVNDGYVSAHYSSGVDVDVYPMKAVKEY